jgi:hypothetical protein
LTVAAGITVSACGSFLPAALPQDLAAQVEGTIDKTAIVWTIQPWPLDETVAYLCLDDPVETFGRPEPRLPSGAPCSAVEAVVNHEALTVRADRSAIDPSIGIAIGIGQEVFLAIAGQRGGVSGAVVVPVSDPLLTIEPGPTG